MEIARKMAGYSLGGADLLRRAMGKKIQAEMDAQKPLFLDGAAKNSVSKVKAEEVWNLLDKFANYGFNKSHAAAYAVVSYQTAWLKANHPVEFMAAVMNCDIHLTDKLREYRQEVARLGIEVMPPCVNRSGSMFAVEDGRILYALGALKNVGVDAMQLITEARADGERFQSLLDFASRVDLRRLGKRALEMLARAGAFDSLDSNRRKVFESLEVLMALSGTAYDDRVSSQVSLFGDIADSLPAPRLPSPEDWSPMERLAQEQASVGFYLSGHPLDDYLPALRREKVAGVAEMLRALGSGGATVVRLAGTVAARDERKSAKGSRYAFVKLSDPSGMYEATVYSDTLEAARAHLEPGQSVVLTVEATSAGDDIRLIARTVQPIDVALAGAASAGIRVFVDDPAAGTSLASRLNEITAAGQAARRRGPVRLIAVAPGLGEVDIDLPGVWPLTPQAVAALKMAPGVVHVEEF